MKETRKIRMLVIEAEGDSPEIVGAVAQIMGALMTPSAAALPEPEGRSRPRKKSSTEPSAS